MTNEKFLEKIYGIIKAIDENRNSYGQVEFDGSTIGEWKKKYNTKELQNFSIRTPEVEFATLISELEKETREAENKKKGGKNGAAKVKALNNILKNAKDSHPQFKYAYDEQINGETMQVFLDGYRAVCLSEKDRIEVDEMPEMYKDMRVTFSTEKATPQSYRAIKRYKINVAFLKALYKNKSAEWKQYKGKHDDKSPAIVWNDKCGFKFDFIMDCVNALGGENIIFEDYEGLNARKLINENGSYAIVLPIRFQKDKDEANRHRWAKDEELDGIFEEIQ